MTKVNTKFMASLVETTSLMQTTVKLIGPGESNCLCSTISTSKTNNITSTNVTMHSSNQNHQSWLPSSNTCIKKRLRMKNDEKKQNQKNTFKVKLKNLFKTFNFIKIYFIFFKLNLQSYLIFICFIN